jgi:hypothetical protein
MSLSTRGQGDAARAPAIEPVPFTAARFEDAFWRPRLEVNREVTVRYDLEQCERTGRIRNFAVAGGLEEGDFEGIYYNDSDVYKVIEGAAYSLATKRDPALEAALDEIVAKIAAAQEEDGYLYTIRTIQGAKISQAAAGPERWSNLAHSHELYNVGHLYEAAVAHHLATGKRNLLDVALRNADLVAKVFGPGEGQRRDVPGHEEIEIGLVKLYRMTGERRYLDLAKFFLDMRGRSDVRKTYGEYAQDHMPVVEQTEPVGHAVRAGYLYSGMADVASILGEKDYVRALERVWDRLVSRRLYLTGGMGAHRHNEGFGEDYDLPNATAYNETCAAIALALWAHRMFLLTGESRFADVFERVVYNGLLSGVSFSGDRFFYPNPLACDGATPFNQGTLGRAPWFDCSCCPVNVVRFLPSLPGHAYAVRADAIFVNFYAAGEATIRTSAGPVRIVQETRYPWEGRIALRVEPERPGPLEVHLRIPGWALGKPVPSDLYRDLDGPTDAVDLRVNGSTVRFEHENGYAVVRREWKKGDILELVLPMDVRFVAAHPAVAANLGRIAVERGPLVFCFEGADNGGSVEDLVLSRGGRRGYRFESGHLQGVGVVEVEATRLAKTADGSIRREPATARAIPYYAWAHRELGPMAVWMAETEDAARPRPAPTIATRARASASHCWSGDTVRAINDQRDPASSGDVSVPRHTWWDHRGSAEWAQLDFAEPAQLSRCAVFWFDDTGSGGCRVPKSWGLSYREGGAWKPVRGASGFGVEKDRFNEVRFEPVRADALRIEVQLQEGFSGGILEWRVE